MNYSWIAYENGLQLLLQRIPQDHYEYENVCALQRCLRQNITQAKSHGDLEALYTARKHILSDLNNLAMQVIEGSFIQLCIASCYLFKYLAHVYKTAHDAHTIFRDGHVWPDQCRRIIDDFWKRPVLAEVTKGITGGVWALSRIDDRVTKLIQLVEEYERISKSPNRRIGNKRDEIIRQLNIFFEEIQTIDSKAFKELIEWYQEDILSADAFQAYSSRIDEDSPLTEAHVDLEPQDQEFAQQPASEYEEEPSQQSVHQQEGNSQQSIHQSKKDASFSEEYIDQTALREAIIHAFSMEELRSLCGDIRQARHREGINDPVSLDTLEGTGLHGKAQSLIEYLDRRNQLSYLTAAVRRVRPSLTF